jgi:hypothetical protein
MFILFYAVNTVYVYLRFVPNPAVCDTIFDPCNVCMCVCMYVCMHACMCMCVCMYVRTYVCMYVYMCVYVCVGR